MSMGNSKKYNITDLLQIMARLRNPDGGCPWDLEQTFESIVPYTIEEAYEVADAVERKDMGDLRDELGDLLLQVVFYSQMAKEAGHFTFDDVVQSVSDKMIHRHPHVFGDGEAKTASDVNEIWEQSKEEKKELESVLDDVPPNLPGVIRAQKLQKRAARVGFEWPEIEQVLDKFDEEIAEMRQALKDNRQEEIKDELGDLFFVLINFARHLGVNAEESIRHANHKFYTRFSGMEKDIKALSQNMSDLTLDEMEEHWQAQKRKTA